MNAKIQMHNVKDEFKVHVEVTQQTEPVCDILMPVILSPLLIPDRTTAVR